MTEEQLKKQAKSWKITETMIRVNYCDPKVQLPSYAVFGGFRPEGLVLFTHPNVRSDFFVVPCDQVESVRTLGPLDVIMMLHNFTFHRSQSW